MIIAAVVVVLLAVAIFYFLKTPKKEIQNQDWQAPASVDFNSKIEELANPVGDKLPDLNPVGKTNPFKNLYKNPFE